jgi:peroxiredoxin
MSLIDQHRPSVPAVAVQLGHRAVGIVGLHFDKGKTMRQDGHRDDAADLIEKLFDRRSLRGIGEVPDQKFLGDRYSLHSYAAVRIIMHSRRPRSSDILPEVFGCVPRQPYGIRFGLNFHCNSDYREDGMRKIVPLFLSLVLAAPLMAQLTAPGVDNSPKVGDIAPDFAIPSATRGAPASSLKDLQGKKRVLLMFFPGAFTPGCTQEFTQAGQDYEKMTGMNIEMIGISRDLPGALSKFKETVGAKNNFVSDTDLKIAPKYDAQNPNSPMFKRYYFLIDETGKILWKNTANQVIPSEKLLADLGQILKK